MAKEKGEKQKTVKDESRVIKVTLLIFAIFTCSIVELVYVFKKGGKNGLAVRKAGDDR